MRRDTLRETLKRTNEKTLKQDRFVAMKKADSENEKIDKDAVKRAHSARSCKEPGKCFEKHLEDDNHKH